MKKHLIIVLLLIGAFVLTPIFTRAQTRTVSCRTIESCSKEIAALRQQLTILRGQENQTSGAWCYTFNTNLSIGMNGSEVSALQTALTRAGFPITATGNFDETTASAVSSFQLKYRSEILTANGLTYPTGYFGPATRAKMNSLFGCGNVIVPPTPIIQPPLVQLPGSSGFLKSSIGRSINTEIVIDTDSFPSISNTELTDFLKIANDILVKKADTEIKLLKVRRISYSALRSTCTISACRGFGAAGTDSGIFYEVYKTDPEPEFIIFFREDSVASVAGGYATTHESLNTSYRNRFRSAEGSTSTIYIGVVDWNGMYASCGYDTSDPKNPKHISNVSIGGECRNRPGTACVLKNSYYQCNDNEMLDSPYAVPGVFVASNAIHELMHQFGNNARDDHYGASKCIVSASTNPYAFEEFAGMCPATFENFKNSYR